MRLRALFQRTRPARPSRLGPPDAAPLHRLPGNATPTDDPVLGLTSGLEVARIGWSDGHILIVGSAGSGSTTTIRSLASQWLGAGIPVDLIDMTYQHGWLGRTPITVHHTRDDVHEFLGGLARTVTSAPPPPQPARRVVILDGNSTLDVLDSVDSHGDWAGSSGLDALRTLLTLGRAHGIRLVLACHGLPSLLTGATLSRFQTRILSMDAAQRERLWDLYGGPTGRPARQPWRAGRFYLVRPATAPTPVQVLQLTDQEAANIATAELADTAGSHA